jgi:DNA-binding GntR family transcriptional regulator
MTGRRGEARYRIIQRDLEKLIVSGDLTVGQQLPTERDLQAQYGVSRITVQRAIQNLVANGLVTRRSGAGTFVAQSAEEQNLLQFTNFLSEGELIHGVHKLLSARVVPVTDPDARLLGIEPGEAVHSLERLKIGDDGPAALEWSVIPFRWAPQIADQDLAELHLYGYFRSIGLKVASARMYLTPHALDDHEATLLNRPKGSLTFLWERISHLDNGSAVELTRMIMNDARRRFYVHFTGN